MKNAAIAICIIACVSILLGCATIPKHTPNEEDVANYPSYPPCEVNNDSTAEELHAYCRKLVLESEGDFDALTDAIIAQVGNRTDNYTISYNDAGVASSTLLTRDIWRNWKYRAEKIPNTSRASKLLSAFSMEYGQLPFSFFYCQKSKSSRATEILYGIFLYDYEDDPQRPEFYDFSLVRGDVMYGIGEHHMFSHRMKEAIITPINEEWYTVVVYYWGNTQGDRTL